MFHWRQKSECSHSLGPCLTAEKSYTLWHYMMLSLLVYLNEKVEICFTANSVLVG